MPAKIRTVTAVFCFNKAGEVLIVRKRNGEYGFPGGRLDAGEEQNASACREFTEETGLDGVELRYMGAYMLPAKIKHKVNKRTGETLPVLKQKRMACYLVFTEATVRPNPQDKHEISSAHFVSVATARMLIPSLRGLLQDAIAVGRELAQSPMRLSA